MREKLTNYIRAGYPGICLLTHEETRAEAELRAITKNTSHTLVAWSATTGLIDTAVSRCPVPPLQRRPLLPIRVSDPKLRLVLLQPNFQSPSRFPFFNDLPDLLSVRPAASARLLALHLLRPSGSEALACPSRREAGRWRSAPSLARCACSVGSLRASRDRLRRLDLPESLTRFAGDKFAVVRVNKIGI